MSLHPDQVAAGMAWQGWILIAGRLNSYRGRMVPRAEEPRFAAAAAPPGSTLRHNGRRYDNEDDDSNNGPELHRVS